MSHDAGVLGIAGSNGSGKSTLLRCMAGLLRPDTGHISWKVDGREISGTVLKEHLGFSAPYVSLYKELTVRENLEFLARLRNIRLADETIRRLLERVALDRAGDQLFGQLSTGQQQRAKLASSMFHNPSALLLDEPGSNLDKAGRELVEQISREFGGGDKLLVIASNNEQELALCDRIFSVELEVFI